LFRRCISHHSSEAGCVIVCQHAWEWTIECCEKFMIYFVENRKELL
jgi:hypothetical protein